MDGTDHRAPAAPSGDLEGRFLVAMPGMLSSIFADSIIYLCAHSAEGAMGFVINKPSDMTLSDLVDKTDLEVEAPMDGKAVDAAVGPLRIGGPVDEHRGFVLHSADYQGDATIRVSSEVSLTSTLDILRAIVAGEGPGRAAIVLGYAGWGAGQLEREIRDNAWLAAEADPAMVFGQDNAGKYDALIAELGIRPAHFVAEGGNA